MSAEEMQDALEAAAWRVGAAEQQSINVAPAAMKLKSHLAVGQHCLAV
jgi:hypothetical protein